MKKPWKTMKNQEFGGDSVPQRPYNQEFDGTSDGELVIF